jgi:hypothetical protein
VSFRHVCLAISIIEVEANKQRNMPDRLDGAREKVGFPWLREMIRSG